MVVNSTRSKRPRARGDATRARGVSSGPANGRARVARRADARMRRLVAAECRRFFAQAVKTAESSQRRQARSLASVLARLTATIEEAAADNEHVASELASARKSLEDSLVAEPRGRYGR